MSNSKLEEIGEFLLENQYYLTALELFQENIEQTQNFEFEREEGGEGGSGGIKCLYDYFITNAPDDLMTEEDVAQEKSRKSHKPEEKTYAITKFLVNGPSNIISRQNQERNDRISLLEYELRIAQEDLQAATQRIKTLEASRPSQEESSTSSTSNNSANKKESEGGESEKEKEGQKANGNGNEEDDEDEGMIDRKLTEREEKGLCYLIKRYLMANNMNMTAITFAEELKGKDVDEWREAGLYEVEKAPSLADIFKKYLYKSVFIPNDYKAKIASLQHDLDMERRKGAENSAIANSRILENEELKIKLAEAAEAADKANETARVLRAKLLEETARFQELHKKYEEQCANPTQPTTTPTKESKEESIKENKQNENENIKEKGEKEKEGGEGERENERERKDESEDKSQGSEEGAKKVSSSLQAQTKKRGTWQEEYKAQRRQNHAALLAERIEEEERLNKEDAKLEGLYKKARDLKEDEKELLALISESLMYLVSGVILAKRDELVPLFFAAIRYGSDPATRCALIRRFYNIFKKPDEPQRAMILRSVGALAALLGPTRTSDEVAPQVVRDAESESEERRALVAATCGVLAPRVRPSVCSAQLLRALLRLSADPAAGVRLSAVKGLAVLVNTFVDGSELDTVQNEVVRLLQDGDSDVVALTRNTLVAALVDWADALEQLPGLLAYFLGQARYTLAELPPPGELDALERATVDANPRCAYCELLIDCVANSTSHLTEAVLLSVPNVQRQELEGPGASGAGTPGVLTQDDRTRLYDAFELLVGAAFPAQDAAAATATATTAVATVNSGSYLVDWTVYKLVPTLLDIVCSAPTCPCNVLDKTCFFMAGVLRGLGANFATRVVQPLVQARFLSEGAEAPGSAGGAAGANGARGRSRVLYFHVVAVLATLPSDALEAFLRGAVKDMVEGRNGFSSYLYRAFKSALLTISTQDGGGRQSAVLSVLSELSCDPAAGVRSCVTSLYSALLAGTVTAEALATLVMPTVRALLADPEVQVRTECTLALLRILSSYASVPAANTAIEGAIKGLHLLARDPAARVKVTLCKSLAVMAPHLPQSQVAEVVLPLFTGMAESLGTGEQSGAEDLELAINVWKALRNYQGMKIDFDTARSYYIPTLKAILKVSTIEVHIRQEVEAKLRLLEEAVLPVAHSQNSNNGAGDAAPPAESGDAPASSPEAGMPSTTTTTTSSSTSSSQDQTAQNAQPPPIPAKKWNFSLGRNNSQSSNTPSSGSGQTASSMGSTASQDSQSANVPPNTNVTPEKKRHKFSLFKKDNQQQ